MARRSGSETKNVEFAAAAVGALLGIMLSDLTGFWTTLLWGAAGAAIGFVAGAVITEIFEP